MKQSRSLDEKNTCGLMTFYIQFDAALAEHSIDQTIDFIQSDPDFKLYDDRSKINRNDKRSDFKHGNPNVFHGKFRLRRPRRRRLAVGSGSFAVLCVSWGH